MVYWNTGKPPSTMIYPPYYIGGFENLLHHVIMVHVRLIVWTLINGGVTTPSYILIGKRSNSNTSYLLIEYRYVWLVCFTGDCFLVKFFTDDSNWTIYRMIFNLAELSTEWLLTFCCGNILTPRNICGLYEHMILVDLFLRLPRIKWGQVMEW